MRAMIVSILCIQHPDWHIFSMSNQKLKSEPKTTKKSAQAVLYPTSQFLALNLFLTLPRIQPVCVAHDMVYCRLVDIWASNSVVADAWLKFYSELLYGFIRSVLMSAKYLRSIPTANRKRKHGDSV